MESFTKGLEAFNEGLAGMPVMWQAWVGWMVLVNTGALLFALSRVEARFIFGAFFLNGIFMTWLTGMAGFTRILGLSHVLFWTPLMVYLIVRVRNEGFNRSSLFGRYVLVVIATDCASLLIDYVDVVRYVLGDRGTA